MRFRALTADDLPRLAKAYAAAFALPPYGESWGWQDAEEHLRAHLDEHPALAWAIYTQHPLLPVGGALGEQQTASRLLLVECFFDPVEHAALGTAFVDALFLQMRERGTRFFELMLQRHAPEWAFRRGFGFRTPTHMQMLWTSGS